MEACRFIREHGTEGPFAMMVGFLGPQGPYDPAPEFLKGFDPDDMPDPIPEVRGDTPEIRRRNIQGNKGSWNGVDYTEFTLPQKKKIRAHYAALVKQIDHEVGDILSALRERGLLENTVIIFASDHGDYLGDHNLIGKGQFFESSWHVPMLVHVPWFEGASTNQELVTLTDVTATMLHFADVEIPAYMDSCVLPGLGAADEGHRQQIFGALNGAWCLYDGEWRLAHYATGESLLFNMRDDPHEQRNLIDDPGYVDVRNRLENALTREVMGSMAEAFFPRRVYVRDLSQTTAFGREGWRRPYPRSVLDR